MTEQYWTQAQVAERTGKSRDAVRYQLKKAKNFENATKNDSGEWIIPVSDVLAVGWQILDDDLDQRDRRIVELEAENRDLAVQLASAKDKIADLALRLADQAPKQIESGLLGNLKRALLG